MASGAIELGIRLRVHGGCRKGIEFFCAGEDAHDYGCEADDQQYDVDDLTSTK
jgi:hypothetical protein